MKKKELKKVIKKFTYKNKKSLCIFMVLAVLAGGVVIVKIRADKSKEIISTANYDRTVLIEKGEISNSINVNGKIESAEVSMVSTSLTEKVNSVNVKVGDYVKAGDVICTLDDGDITKEIEKKKAEIAENKKELEANYNKLSNQLTEARNVKIASVSAQDSIVSSLKRIPVLFDLPSSEFKELFFLYLTSSPFPKSNLSYALHKLLAIFWAVVESMLFLKCF